MTNRLTFGFKNTEILFGIFVFFALLIFVLWMIFLTNFIFSLVIFWQLMWGFSFGFMFKDEDLSTEKGYFGAFLWAIGLVAPFSFLVKNFSFNKIVNFINNL